MLLEEDHARSERYVVLSSDQRLHGARHLRWRARRHLAGCKRDFERPTVMVADLRAAGITVGSHSCVLQLPDGGYYVKHYPSMVSTIDSTSGRCYTFNNSLLDTVATDYAKSIKDLNPNWIYFDGAEPLFVESGQVTDKYDGFLRPLVTSRMLRQLRSVGFTPITFQTSTSQIDSYPYVSGAGHVDFWSTSTPTSLIDQVVKDAPAQRMALLTPDLGWFGVNIRTTSTPSGFRPATLSEWQYMCDASRTHNIPIGIEASYGEVMNSPLRDTIIQMVHDTILQRAAAFP